MSKLQIINAETMEKLLFLLGFKKFDKKEVMHFTDKEMAGPQLFRTIKEGF